MKSLLKLVFSSSSTTIIIFFLSRTTWFFLFFKITIIHVVIHFFFCLLHLLFFFYEIILGSSMGTFSSSAMFSNLCMPLWIANRVGMRYCSHSWEFQNKVWYKFSWSNGRQFRSSDRINLVTVPAICKTPPSGKSKKLIEWNESFINRRPFICIGPLNFYICPRLINSLYNRSICIVSVFNLFLLVWITEWVDQFLSNASIEKSKHF